jgi:hypothetical protein
MHAAVAATGPYSPRYIEYESKLDALRVHRRQALGLEGECFFRLVSSVAPSIQCGSSTRLTDRVTLLHPGFHPHPTKRTLAAPHTHCHTPTPQARRKSPSPTFPSCAASTSFSNAPFESSKPTWARGQPGWSSAGAATATGGWGASWRQEDPSRNFYPHAGEEDPSRAYYPTEGPSYRNPGSHNDWA